MPFARATVAALFAPSAWAASGSPSATEAAVCSRARRLCAAFMVTEDAADGETIRLASGLLKAGRRATMEIMLVRDGEI